MYNHMKIRLSTAVILNEKDEILMMLRDNNSEIMNPGIWGFIGGHSEKNESAIDTLVREVKEETGLNIGKHICNGPFFMHESNARGDIERSVFVVKGNWTDKDIIKGEGQEIKFIPFEKLSFMKVSSHIFMVLNAVGLFLKKEN